ncbi:GFA family protein [Sphingomonas japonica]|uniref:CENP-V/GFA domain-containing protein n=1 Tax=Sphingomonas japonica TaxID=511662 RepID=A0ABX0U0R2_9SPHN|nr:GFA family protein [Sphingomonas japonica]NIJ24151.1 hypothetical protein [Sphingomonas japonica]
MAEPVQPTEGSCRCGAVAFRVTAAPMLTMACHCTGCQKMTGSAFSTSVAIPTDGFEVVAGETVRGGLGTGDLHHHHCDACKSWLFTTFASDMGFINVRATLLDDAAAFVPFVETFVAEKLPWADTPAPHKFDAFPPIEAMGPIVQEFSAR